MSRMTWCITVQGQLPPQNRNVSKRANETHAGITATKKNDETQNLTAWNEQRFGELREKLRKQ